MKHNDDAHPDLDHSQAAHSRPNRVLGQNPDDPRLLDLLVDGELTPGERRELLTRLDEQPEGWRRCALAFLEAQAWQQDLGGMSPEDLFGPAPAAEDSATLVSERETTVVSAAQSADPAVPAA